MFEKAFKAPKITSAATQSFITGPLLFFLLVFHSGCAPKTIPEGIPETEIPASRPEAPVFKTKSAPLKPVRTYSAYDVLNEKVARVAQGYMGKGYRFGANPDKTPFSDCSNLVSAITRNSLKGSDFKFPSYYYPTKQIYRNSYEIKRYDIMPGDIVYFKRAKGKSDHAGVITRVQDKAVYFIHASTSIGVTKTSTKSESWNYYWKEKFDSFRRWDQAVFKKLR